MNYLDAVAEVRAGRVNDRVPELLEAFQTLRQRSDPDASYWTGYLLYYYGDDLGLMVDPLPFLEVAANTHSDDFHARYLFGCALFDRGQLNSAEVEFREVVHGTSPADEQTVELYLLALEMLAVIHASDRQGPELIERVLSEWEWADGRFGGVPGLEVHARPWQLDRYCASLKVMDREQRGRLKALLAC